MDRKVLAYVVPLLAYVIAPSLVSLFTENIYLNYLIKTVVTAIFIIYYCKEYKLKFKWDSLAVFTGIAIFILWIGIEGFYKPLGTSEFNPLLSDFIIPIIIIRILGAVIIAPLVEEIFTRGFLIRALVSKNWDKVKTGTYTHASFLLTVIFFGFAHNRWLPGIITGIILNLLLYKRKSIESCIIAHAVANLALAVFVLSTQNWIFW